MKGLQGWWWELMVHPVEKKVVKCLPSQLHFKYNSSVFYTILSWNFCLCWTFFSCGEQSSSAPDDERSEAMIKNQNCWRKASHQTIFNLMLLLPLFISQWTIFVLKKTSFSGCFWIDLDHFGAIIPDKHDVCCSLSYTKLTLLKAFLFSTLDSATCPSAERVHQFLLDHFVLFLKRTVVAQLLSIVSNVCACCMSDQPRITDMGADILPLTTDAKHVLCRDWFECGQRCNMLVFREWSINDFLT